MEDLLTRNDLHQYQNYCIDFIESKATSAIFLNCGLGKTIISLTAIHNLMFDKFDISKVLVIAPLRVTTVWANEIKKWDHLKGLSYSVAVGTEKERKDALMKRATLYIINRENIDWLVNKSGIPFDFDMVVIDELSSFKSYSAKRFKSLKK